jgi:hypothetical protein
MKFAIILSTNAQNIVIRSIESDSVADAYNELRVVLDQTAVKMWGGRRPFRSARNPWSGYSMDTRTGATLILENLSEPSILTKKQVKALAI